MPYYCTVPRCTSMAGKAKNVSFHQFPRDEDLARLWNSILKRGKPYTKYSKVCSLHFKPEDYTITSVGKNKGQWRTLRKDAIPSQNLPSESPPLSHRSRSGDWTGDGVCVDPRMQHQMAQAIYMQAMLAMSAATNGSHQGQQSDTHPNTPNINLTELELLLKQNQLNKTIEHTHLTGQISKSYKCDDCPKCFKDPDVFLLHKRLHTNSDVRHSQSQCSDKIDSDIRDSYVNNSQCSDKNDSDMNNSQYSDIIESVIRNSDRDSNSDPQETLRANPILANLLKSNSDSETFDFNNVLGTKNQIMTALSANIKNLSTILSHSVDNVDNFDNCDGNSPELSNCVHNSQTFDNNQLACDDDFSQRDLDVNSHCQNSDNSDQCQANVSEKDLRCDGNLNIVNMNDNGQKVIENGHDHGKNNVEFSQNLIVESIDKEVENCENFPIDIDSRDNQNAMEIGSAEINCDSQDLNMSRVSSELVIDETI